MKKYLITGIFLGATAVSGISQYYQKLYKTTPLGPTAVLITCVNGADPTGNKVLEGKDVSNNTLIVSCANQAKK